MKTKVSVIVPVYNTGDLLVSCLDSLSAQTLPEMEVILIDDGSTDGSGAVCDTYAKKDARFRVIHKENQGVSRARNEGLRAAQGEYIGFVDSDDTVSPDMFCNMFFCAQRECADIVLCDSAAKAPGKPDVSETIFSLPKSILLKKADITPDILLEIAGSACRCVYRRELLLREEIQFPVDLKFSEDRIFNILAMGAANRIYYEKTTFYNRILHPSSTVHKFHADYFEIVKDAAQRTSAALEQAWDNQEAFQTAYLKQFINGALAAINNYFYKTATISTSIAMKHIKSICNDSALRTAILRTGYGGIRGKWILKRRILLLSLCAICLNKKYGR